MQLHAVFPEDMGRDLTPDVVDDQGQLKVMPAAYYAQTTVEERAVLGMTQAVYCLPTHELVEYLRERIAGRSAIEIGAGAGVLSRALRIPAVDNHMQAWPHIAAHYARLGQPTIQYGPHVENMDANQAVRERRPQVVIAAWVTHRYDAAREHAGGNAHGVVEEDLLEHCEEYILVGNEAVHEHKSLWSRPATVEYPDWLYSRAINGSRDFVASWTGARACG